MSRLAQERYLAFPLSLTEDGASTSSRAAHIREQIWQTLFTSPGERLFRPTFGAGAEQLVFEPNQVGLELLTTQRLTASLTEVLAGEVDPKTLRIEVARSEETLTIVISYQIAALSQQESHEFILTPGLRHG